MYGRRVLARVRDLNYPDDLLVYDTVQTTLHGGVGDRDGTPQL